jgi:glycosyltransferase involved in cell wall biosynthesis
VTFIIAYYNLPVQMLCQCIDSILALPLQADEREIIVVDDGSGVSPMNGLMHYGTEIVYVRQKNGGLSMARNTGINMAQGRFLQFVDADDHLITDAYAHCLDIVRNQPDAEMVIFDFTTTETTATTYKDAEPVSGTELMRRQNIHGTACGYMFRKTTLSQLRFTHGIVHEDEEFTPQLLIRAERVYVTDAKAYYYYKRPGSIITSTDDDSKQQRLNDARDIILRLRHKADRLPSIDRLALQRRIDQLTMDYIYNIMTQTQSKAVLEERISQLKAEGLFPLADRDYTQKYKWFRKMTMTSLGRSMLLHTLPLLNKER